MGEVLLRLALTMIFALLENNCLLAWFFYQLNPTD